MKQIKIDLQYLRNLLLAYEKETDEKEKINLRNCIIELLLPVTRAIMLHYRKPLDEDMLQESFIAMVKAVRNWDSNRSKYLKADIMYFNRCMRNFAINYCKKTERVVEKEVPIEILDQEIFEMLGQEDIKHKSLDHEWNPYEESPLADAYSCALHSIMGTGVDHSSNTDLRKKLQKKFGISQGEADEAINQAEISLREVFVDSINMNETKFEEYLKQCKLFKRMIPYIEEGDLEGLIKVFGGMKINVPKGV
jgi:DNA-directed RNA polymerase specialized sigma subunit